MSQSNQFIVKSHRTADEPIYLNEEYYETPLERYKFLGSLLHQDKRPTGSTVLDIGCATGGFLYYLSSKFPEFTFSGGDVSEKMLAVGRERQPKIDFHKCSILDTDFFENHAFDIIFCAGVLPLIDDIALALGNLVAGLKPGGSVYVFNSMNLHPIDTLVRYRHAEPNTTEWESGRNIWSAATVENGLGRNNPKIEISTSVFEMPFDIAPRDDPMRTWTIGTSERKRQLINGAGQIVNITCVHAKLP